MEFKLSLCPLQQCHFKVVDKVVPVMCCGQKMEEFVPPTPPMVLWRSNLAVEKIAHGSGYSVSSEGGGCGAPMLPEHYISMIAAVDGDTAERAWPQ